MGSSISSEELAKMTDDEVLAITQEQVEKMKQEVQEEYYEKKGAIEAARNQTQPDAPGEDQIPAAASSNGNQPDETMEETKK